METVEKQNFIGQTIAMDGKVFIRCTFTDCDLTFSGGNTEWQETHFENCRLGFGGAAKRTVQYLWCFGLQMPEPHINSITAMTSCGTSGTTGSSRFDRPN